MKSKFKTTLFLCVILLASLFVRLYQIGSIPNGLTVDEADMAYNAYSILQTGKDVYNQKYPLFFQSLDDYKPGIPIYLTIPAVKFFGLNEYSARLAPALIGTLTPLLAFALFRTIYPNSKMAASAAAILFAFAPWNVAISRATFMYIELIFCYLLALTAFFLAIRKNNYWLIVTAITLGISLYVYYAAIFYLPFIILAMSFYYKDLLINKKTLLVSLLLLVLCSLPAAKHYLTSESRTRFNAVSIFTPDIALPLSIKETDADKSEGLPLAALMHNRRLVYANHFFNNYFDYFNLDYLFINSSNVRYFYTNWIGLFFAIEVPFFVLGLIHLIRNCNRRNSFYLLLLIAGPIPAAVTLGSPFPHRAILFILIAQIISIVGINQLMLNLKFRRFTALPLILVYILSVYIFVHQYFFHGKHEFNNENNNGAWFSSIRESLYLIEILNMEDSNIVFTWPTTKTVPGIYHLFYNKIDPEVVQGRASALSGKDLSFKNLYNNLDHFQARRIDWRSENDKNNLFVVYEKELPSEPFKVLGQTFDENGKIHFLLIKLI